MFLLKQVMKHGWDTKRRGKNMYVCQFIILKVHTLLIK